MLQYVTDNQERDTKSNMGDKVTKVQARAKMATTSV